LRRRHRAAAANVLSGRYPLQSRGETCGKSLSSLAATHPGQEVAVARNVHKSVISGLILSGARPVFVEPVGLRLDGSETTSTSALLMASPASPDATRR